MQVEQGFFEEAAGPGDVAQWLEHLLCTQGVGGSTPLVSTEEVHVRPGVGRELVAGSYLLRSPPSGAHRSFHVASAGEGRPRLVVSHYRVEVRPAAGNVRALEDWIR